MNLSRIARIQLASEQGKMLRFKTGLKEGAVISGRVAYAFGSDQYLVSLRGVNLIAQSDIPMKKGDRFKAVIKGLQPRLILKIIHAEDEVQELADKWGVKGEGKDLLSEMASARLPLLKEAFDRINAAVRKFARDKNSPAGYAEISRAAVKLEQLNLPLTTENISRQMAALKSEFDLSSLMAALVKLLNANMDNLSAETGRMMKGVLAGFNHQNIIQNLPAVAALLGLIHESALKAILTGGGMERKDSLKALLLALRELFPAAEEVILPGIDELEAMQLRNLPENRSASGDTYYIQVPICCSGEWENLDLFFHSEGGGREKLDKDNAAIRINFDSRRLGKLSVLVEIQNGALSVNFYFEREEMAGFIQPRLGELEKALSACGYRISAISVSHHSEVDDSWGFSAVGDESLNMII